jgi:RHS repeat-associated protein
MRAVIPPDGGSYPYAETGYVNPDAVTQIANGLSTTTFTYDNNGNVTQKTVDGTTTTYVYDYANRLTALGVSGATTTYAYDWAGSRVSQTGTTTTYLYPFKWYSVASSTGSGAKYATTTDYVFNGDTLVATVDQQTASGNATGTAKSRYIHPDHLGSTNVVTDENDNVVQTLDFYPYGATRVSSATSTNERRKYIGQFSDDSGLSYLNARFYDSGRGQFLSEDPAFLSLGNGGQLQQLSQQSQQKFLMEPQQLNSYSYSKDNPVTNKDPQGLLALQLGGEYTVPLWGLSGEAGVYIDQNGIDYYYGTGLAAGQPGGAHASVGVTSADLSHTYSISTGLFATGGDVLGGAVEEGMTYYPYSLRRPQPYAEAGLGLAAELAAGGMAHVSGPLLVWSQPQSINYSLPRPQMVSNIQGNQTNYSQNLNAKQSNSSQNTSASFSQVLSSLQSMLQQLNAILSTYRANTSH